jgi:peptide/nickel transport system substrate-binding protein
MAGLLRGSRRVAAGSMALALALTACSSGGDTTTSGSATTAASTASDGKPKAGGKLVMGTEAEVDGFDPTKNRFDITGLTYASTVFDALAAFGKDGKVHPYLAETIDHNDTYTEWTIKLRSGIKFSNGDPLTSDAVVTDLQAHQKSSLTGPAISSLKTVAKVDDLTVKVTTDPWVPFPTYLTGQIGYVFNPKMLTDPKGSQNPIGTGPFVIKEWIPGQHFTATKNPSYWQQGLPYLDEIEYRPITELQSRISSLLAKDVDLFHSSDPKVEKDLGKDKSVKLTSDRGVKGETEEGFVMLNTGKPPFDDVKVRQALAYATDQKKVIDQIDFGLVDPVDGPFGNSGSPFHKETSYPKAPDLAKAKALIDDYKKTHPGNLTFELGTTNVGRNLQLVSLLQSMWQPIGVNVTIKQVQQSEFILNALKGDYQAYTWRQFGAPDPDAEAVWWSSLTAAKQGDFALNFARNKDTDVDQGIGKGRISPNDADRVAAYQAIAERFAQDVPYVWLTSTVWYVASQTNVTGLTTWKLPDGSEGIDHLVGGGFLMTHVGRS